MDPLPVFVFRGDVAQRRDKLPLGDHCRDGKVGRLLRRFKIPTNGILPLKRLVADIRPFRVLGAERQEPLIVALSDRRICLRQNRLMEV